MLLEQCESGAIVADISPRVSSGKRHDDAGCPFWTVQIRRLLPLSVQPAAFTASTHIVLVRIKHEYLSITEYDLIPSDDFPADELTS